MNKQEAQRFLTIALLSVPVAAYLLDVSLPTVYRWIEANKLDAVNMSVPGAKNTTYLVRTESVKKLLEEKG